jgi:hypothetical protein
MSVVLVNEDIVLRTGLDKRISLETLHDCISSADDDDTLRVLDSADRFVRGRALHEVVTGYQIR